MDKLCGMEAFAAVVENGSFTSVVMRLGMSAVTVGKYITQPEAQFGTHLLERNMRHRSLTDAGRVYLEEARRVLGQISIAECPVERLRLTPVGTPCVSAPTSSDVCMISLLVAALLQIWPEACIELDLTNRMVDLVSEGVDLAIHISDTHQTDVVAKYLCPYRTAIRVSSDYLAHHGTPRAPVDLVDHLCLSHTVWTARNEWISPGVTGGARWKRDAILHCNNGHGLRMAMVAGAGLLS